MGKWRLATWFGANKLACVMSSEAVSDFKHLDGNTLGHFDSSLLLWLLVWTVRPVMQLHVPHPNRGCSSLHVTVFAQVPLQEKQSDT